MHLDALMRFAFFSGILRGPLDNADVLRIAVGARSLVLILVASRLLDGLERFLKPVGVRNQPRHKCFL